MNDDDKRVIPIFRDSDISNDRCKITVARGFARNKQKLPILQCFSQQWPASLPQYQMEKIKKNIKIILYQKLYIPLL